MVLRWAHLIIVLVVQVFLAGGIYASIKFQVEDHARRLDTIERRQQDNFITSGEYEKRHQDLIEQIRELRAEVRELEHKSR